MAPAAMGKQEALAKFSVDLTEQARKGEIDPIVGRDEEIRQIVDILMRRRQNNPILTGEAGVGKTAVVEGFALRIVAGDVPPALKDVTLRTLDVGLLQAGASMKGEFENRLRQVIEEVQASPKPIILFIDEAHTLIGAGGAAGTGDAANLLKPALARGTLRTIAATTWAEYKKYFEKDPALTRRFQVVQVDEPTEDKAILMMRGIAAPLEKHHRVQSSTKRSKPRCGCRIATSRRGSCPTRRSACSTPPRPASRSASTPCPPTVEDCRRRIEALETELDIIARETAIGIDAADARDRGRSAALADGERTPGRAGSALGRGKGDWSTSAAARLRGRACATAAAPRRTVPRSKAAGPRTAEPRPRRECSHELRELQAELAAHPGRNPADPAQRRRAGRRRRGRRLDRHSRRPHGEERNRSGAATWPTRSASASSASATAWR